MQTTSGYSDEFFSTRHDKTVFAARTILSIIHEVADRPRSVIDIGCGVGTWLKVATEFGASDVLGVDGPWVSNEHLVIPKSNFRIADFETGYKPDKKFDLAISLEVAEHVSQAASDQFVSTLCSASDLILFSAAVPGQGGVMHVNEQWQDYWREKFDNHGFTALDIIRPRIWSDRQIPLWYRQNTILYTNAHRRQELAGIWEQKLKCPRMPISIVHPDMYEFNISSLREQLEETKTYPGIIRLLISLLRKRIGAARQSLLRRSNT
jgi:SAM-dependent methyltransferase